MLSLYLSLNMNMATLSRPFSLLHPMLVLYFLHLLVTCTEAANVRGFTTDLIHRDSPLLPFYDPTVTQKDRLAGAIRRSISRLSHFKSSLKMPNKVDEAIGVDSQIVAGNGEYLMKISIGTPPFEQLAIADTGSDVTWTQCLPCRNCYKQRSPIFNSKKSSTFQVLPCLSQTCEALGQSNTCPGSKGKCQYQLSYGDQSYSIGELALETFTLGGRSLPKLAYGCGHENQGTFDGSGAGIVGLGGGQLSLVNQLGRPIGGKFSYCLVPWFESNSNISSKISFGADATVAGPGVVSTPLASKEPDTYYYLTLEGISVGKTRLPMKTLSKSGPVSDVEEGNIIIDSGTTLTYLPSDFYQDLEDTLRNEIQADPTEDPRKLLNLCYSNSDQINPPAITVHFSGGADLVLPATSTFVQNGDLLCLAMLPNDQLAIFGNLSQMDFLIGYDLGKRQVSFMPTDCTKH